MPVRKRPGSSSNSHSRRGSASRRSSNRRGSSRSEPRYGWQNVYLYWNEDGTISGSIVFSEDFLMSLALRIAGKEYEGDEEDPPINYDDDGNIRLMIKLRESQTSKTDFLGNVYESEPKSKPRNVRGNSRRASRYDDDGDDEEEEERPRKKRRTRNRPSHDDDDDNYDDVPF